MGKLRLAKVTNGACRQAIIRTQALWQLVQFLNPTVSAQNLSTFGNSSYVKGSFEYFHLLNTNIEISILLCTLKNTKLTSYSIFNSMHLKILQNSFYILVQSKHIY